MSLEMVLIPVAIAAYAAWKARSSSGLECCSVETRWRHSGLLLQALGDLGAADAAGTTESTSATVDGIAATFVRGPDGIVTAHFPLGTDVDAATAIVTRIDGAYTRRVQDTVYRRIRDRVDELGYEVVSDTVDDDETITLVVNVGDA